MLKISRILLLLLIGLFGSVGATQTAEDLDELAAKAQSKPDDPKLHYELALAYAHVDSADLTVAEYKTLLRLNAAGADDPYLRTKVASFLDLEPYPLSPVLSDSAADRAPFFGGRGDELVYESSKDGPWQIYLTNINGDSVRRITHDTMPSGQPALAPNGSTIGYARVSEKGWKLALINRGDTIPKIFDDIPGLARSPSFSPDGREIAFQWQNEGDEDFEIAILNPKSGKVRSLTENIYFDGKPKFSRDGKKIVYHSNQNLNFDIYVMDRNGKNPHPVAGNPASDFDPCFWGSDRIVFSSNRDGNFEIYLLDLKKNDILRLTNNNAEDREPTVSGDGHWLAFRSDRTKRYQIYAFDLTKPVSREELAKKLAEE
jgi:Tol biopolymer transport system component